MSEALQRSTSLTPEDILKPDLINGGRFTKIANVIRSIVHLERELNGTGSSTAIEPPHPEPASEPAAA